jgi:hypothetical protein
MSTNIFISQLPFSFVARSSADKWDNVIAYDRDQPGVTLLPSIA